jgi:hypothetical protein
MAARSRFSTSTVIDSEYLVPWLSAEGPLAYTPTNPPSRDYFFQYTWILPGIFNPQVNLREHRYFGSPHKDSARFLFDFWTKARRGDGPALQRYCQFGFFSDNEVRTPMAAYHHVRDYRDTPGSLLIQHGSYQWVSLEDQPSLPAGEVSLYRGIGQATRFRGLRFRPEELSPANGEIWRKYLRVQADMLSDSILSFNTIHDRLKRCETADLRDGTWVGDELATQAGLDIQSPGFAGDLWHAAQQSYSLERVMGEVKFGPHHVVVKTPLSNIRITTFLAGESEAKIVDPNRISLVQAVGCEVDFAPNQPMTPYTSC